MDMLIGSQKVTTMWSLVNFQTIITHLSKYFTVQMGDYFYTGTPAGVGPVKIGDRLEGFINGKKMLKCDIM